MMPGRKRVDVSSSINSGQVFLWERHGGDGAWLGIDGDNVLRIGGDFDPDSCGEAEYDFFRLGDEYERMLRDVSRDGMVRRGVEKYRGLRLLRQDPFQCYISFIVSSNSSIPSIRQRLKKMCRKFGRKARLNQVEHHLFPDSKRLASASVGELQSCGLGYRAKFVRQAAEIIAGGGISLESLKRLDYDAAKSELIQVPGIGDKVADCIMLFSLEKLDSFPLDTWMLKVLREFYSERFSTGAGVPAGKRYGALHDQIVDYFGAYAGVSQQFLFKLIRDQNRKKWL